MAPFIVLYFIPIGLIAIVIIAIIRLIIRASSGSSNSSTNYNQYRQPPPQQGQYNNPPQQNPYQQQQQQQNPYVNSPPDLNNPNPETPPAWQNPSGVQQPDLTQPNYNQPNYTQPNYNQPNYTQPNYTQPNYTQSTWNEPGVSQPGNTRSTSIGNQNYSTYTGAVPEKKSNKTGMIVLFSIIGIVVIAAASIGFIAYQRTSGGASLVSEEFRLAYENPTENTYFIVLDEWDTIKVEPYTSTEDLDYTHRRDLEQFHWQMLTEDLQMVAETTVTKEEMESWVRDRTSSSWGYSTVLLNPSQTEYVYYTAWFDEEGLDYMDDMPVGDTTYFCDGYTTSEAFIFDERDPEYQTDLSAATSTSELDENQYLLSKYDFMVLYAKLNYEDPRTAKMEEFREQLQDLFTVAKEEVMVNNAYDSDDVLTCYSLDSMTPGEIGEYSEPRDFIPSIDFVKEHSSLFRYTAPEQYKYVVDSADALLKRSYYGEQAPPPNYISMRRLSYTVDHEGILADEPVRDQYYEVDRNVVDATYY